MKDEDRSTVRQTWLSKRVQTARATMNRRLALIGSVIGMLGPATSAAQSNPVDPAKIDAVFASMANTQSPGCAVATIRDGRLDYARGYGMADIKRGVPITTKTAMNLGSATKQFTAAAINLLAAERRLTLDDDVKKYVQELPRYDATVTIRQLMNHTSGVRDHSSLATLAGWSDDISDADALAMLARQRTNFTPGTLWSYSNGGYFLLSVIVERVSGQPLPAFAAEQLFRPLGMTSTVFRVRSDVPKGRALGYTADNGKRKTVEPRRGAVGHGGLFSTLEDLVLWQRHMETPRLGGAKWRELTDARGTLPDGTSIVYGAGVIHATSPASPLSNTTAPTPGATSFVMRLPALRLSIVVLCNRESPGQNFAMALGRRVAALYVGPRPAPVAPAAGTPTVTLPPERLASYAGMFFNEQLPEIVHIAVDGGKLVWFGRGELVPLGSSRFQIAGTEALATFMGPDTIVFDRLPSQPVAYVSRLRGWLWRPSFFWMDRALHSRHEGGRHRDGAQHEPYLALSFRARALIAPSIVVRSSRAAPSQLSPRSGMTLGRRLDACFQRDCGGFEPSGCRHCPTGRRAAGS